MFLALVMSVRSPFSFDMNKQVRVGPDLPKSACRPFRNPSSLEIFTSNVCSSYVTSCITMFVEHWFSFHRMGRPSKHFRW